MFIFLQIMDKIWKNSFYVKQQDGIDNANWILLQVT